MRVPAITTGKVKEKHIIDILDDAFWYDDNHQGISRMRLKKILRKLIRTAGAMVVEDMHPIRYRKRIDKICKKLVP